MISTIASQATSLFQYIDDQRSGAQFVSDMGELTNQTASKDVDDIQSGLVNVQSMDTLVDQVMSGESNVTAEKVDDMLNFYFNQVKSEIKETSDGFGLQQVPAMQLINGEWQLAQSSNNKKLNNFVEYVNKDQRLSERMEKAMKLSELNEQVTARAQAQTLKNEDVADTDIESYLLDTSNQVQANRFLSIEQGNLKLGNAGIAKEQAERFTTTDG